MATKILIIGSNSFSGSDLIDLLLEDRSNDVIGISRSAEKSELFLPYKRHKKPRFSFQQMDLNKDMPSILRLVDSFRPDYIVNFAAQSEVMPSWYYPDQWFETNIVALARLANHLKKKSYFKKFVHISSPEVYGTTRGKVKENATINPSTPYAVSKAAADFFLYTLYKHYHFPLVTIRSTNVYGAHQQLFKIIPKTIITIRTGKKIGLDGGGRAVKSYIHVRDISKAELKAISKGRIGEMYHLAPNEGISINDLVKMICKKMGVNFSKVTKVAPERLGQDMAYIVDSSKARKEFSWRPKVGIDQGIEGVVKWIDDNWAVIKTLPREYIHRP